MMVTRLLEESMTVEQALEYSVKKVDAGVATIISVNNIADDSIQGIRRRLYALERKNIRTERTVFHMAVNPIAEDKMDKEKVIAYIRDVMAGFGYAGQPYVVFRHNDIAREHYHVVSVRTDESGRCIVPMAKNKQGKMAPCKLTHRLCEKLQKNLQKKYHYTLGPVGGYDMLLSTISPFDHSRGKVKLQLNNILDKVADGFHFTTSAQLSDIMEHYHVRVKYVPSKHQKGKTAIVLNGTDADGKVITRAVYRDDEAAVRLSNAKLRYQNPEWYTTNKISTLQIITSCLHAADSEGHLARALEEKEIEMKISRSEDGKAFGATFYDWKMCMALKSSELSKAILKFIQAGDFSTEAKSRTEQALLFDIGKFDEKCALHCRFDIIASDVRTYADTIHEGAGGPVGRYLGQVKECASMVAGSPDEHEYAAAIDRFIDESQAFFTTIASRITGTLDDHGGSREGKREARRRVYRDIQFLRKLCKDIEYIPGRKYDVIANKAEEKLSPVMKSIEAALEKSMSSEEVTTENMAFKGDLCSEYYDCNKYNSRRGMGTLVHNSIVNRDFLKTDFMIGHSYTAPEVWATPDTAVQIFAYETEDGCRYLARSIFRNYDINVNPDRFYIADPCTGGTTPESFEWKDRFGNPHTLVEVVRHNIKKNHPSWKMVERACSEKEFTSIKPAGKFLYAYNSARQFKLLYADGKEVISQWLEGLSKAVDGKTIVKSEGRYNLLDLTTGYLSMSEWLPFMGDFKDGWALVLNDCGKCNFIGTSGLMMTSDWFDKATEFKGGTATVERKGQKMDIGTDGIVKKIFKKRPGIRGSR